MMKMVTTKELELCEKKVGVVPPADEIAKSREKAGPRGCADGEVGRPRPVGRPVGRPRGCGDGEVGSRQQQQQQQQQQQLQLQQQLQQQPRGCADGGSRPGMQGRPKAQLELRW